jgi:hypothetical protein
MTLDPNAFKGSDSERIQAAVDAATKAGGTVVIPARVPDTVSARDYWLLDRAILLPGSLTLVLDNCRLKLSDRSRDNFIRSANCGLGIGEVKPLRDIHILGVGAAVLEGADRPRATGDAAKTLSADVVRKPGGSYVPISYGTDAGKPGESQKSDWRSIGILLARVERFSLRNLTLKDTHSWAISLEHCAFGTLRDLEFWADGGKTIDGAFRAFLNQDGLDLRQGCHDITIDGVAGHTGDDLVALTAIPIAGMGAGSLNSHMVGGMEPGGPQDDVHDILIRNVRGCAGGCQLVRFLNTGGIRMYRIILDGVLDAAPEGVTDTAVVVVGDSNPAWGGVTPLGDTYGFVLNNIQGRARRLVEIRGSLSESVIGNLINYNDREEPVVYTSGKAHVRNVSITNAITVGR